MADIKDASVNLAGTISPATQPNWIPSRKLIAAGIGGILYSVGAYFLQKYTGIVIPAEIQPYIVSLIMSGIFYVVPPSVQDVIRNLNNEIVAMAQADPTSPVTTPVVTRAEAIPVIVGTQTPGSSAVTPVTGDKGPQE